LSRRSSAPCGCGCGCSTTSGGCGAPSLLSAGASGASAPSFDGCGGDGHGACPRKAPCCAMCYESGDGDGGRRILLFFELLPMAMLGAIGGLLGMRQLTMSDDQCALK
jgi:hypothetical protein